MGQLAGSGSLRSSRDRLQEVGRRTASCISWQAVPEGLQGRRPPCANITAVWYNHGCWTCDDVLGGGEGWVWPGADVRMGAPRVG
jgi:hypothetical protein